MTLKREMTVGRSKVTLFIVITLDLEFNSVCRRNIPDTTKYMGVTRAT